jgi:hypothetical protein
MPEFGSSPNSGFFVLENNLRHKLEDARRARSRS